MAAAAGSEDGGGGATTPVRLGGEQLLLLSAEGVARSTVPSSPDDPAPKLLHYGLTLSVPDPRLDALLGAYTGFSVHSVAGSEGLADGVLGEVEDAAYWTLPSTSRLPRHHPLAGGSRHSSCSSTTLPSPGGGAHCLREAPRPPDLLLRSSICWSAVYRCSLFWQFIVFRLRPPLCSLVVALEPCSLLETAGPCYFCLVHKILALEAIYGDNLDIFGEKSVPRSFQIQVHCEIPDGISVSTELQNVDDYPDNQFIFSVKLLAPISLTCLMPPSYPSHHPPYFSLGVQWLDTVKGSTLSHLGFDGGIIICKSDSTMAPVDARVVGEILSVEDVVQRLISYDEELCLETFLRGLHVCTICFSEHPVITGDSEILWLITLDLKEYTNCK